MKNGPCAWLLIVTCLVVFGEVGRKAEAAPRSARAQSRPSSSLAKGRQLISDDFARDEMGEKWRQVIKSFRVEEETLVGAEVQGVGHGAVCETLVNFKDIVLEFSFKLDGSKQFNLVIDDKNHKDSHAGHICRVTVRQNKVLLQDDKTGAMQNDIFAARRENPKDTTILKKLEGKSFGKTVKLDPNKWYRMQVILSGDEMSVGIDGKLLGQLRSEGIGHATKTDFGFTVLGASAYFDDVQAWELSADGN